MVTAKDNKDHWLHEGFATFYALLTEKKIFRNELLLLEIIPIAEELKALSDKGKGEAVTQLKASSLTYYTKRSLGFTYFKGKSRQGSI